MASSPDGAVGLAFLERSAEQKQQLLRELGMGRYAQLLLALSRPTPENLACLERFLLQPQRAKFPDLRGVDLAGADLRRANLIRANLTNALLQNANLEAADIILASLQGADLRGANLREATLNEIDWHLCQVSGADLSPGKGLTAAEQSMLRRQGARIDL
ncbi:pentapeptide repeat-containing protein [Leptolyngbya sp. FACHB-261]|uniref:pentapeptide repeat-containing protein n=1 Tax=Leptolyngbya sp. FACHB-261 TaxID=2692806 RepID=UPI0016834FFC|nr:pentapeptide repeat-containing protein [Leptolyngbya sp. FACHB-261]MBD2101889.1 pentapeptide repeat-containing protein [Leptolyngbya sp. FACHB-261]